MNLRPQDVFMVALCAWRENRSGHAQGMQSVCNCIMNRVAKWHQTPYHVVTASEQFSSITDHGDQQLALYPTEVDPWWAQALDLATQALEGSLADLTLGSTNYFAPSIPMPSWAKGMVFTVSIAGQNFYK